MKEKNEIKKKNSIIFDLRQKFTKSLDLPKG